MTCWEFGDNVFVNYDVTTVEINTSSVVCAGNVNCDVSSFQSSNISNTDITGDKECTIPDVLTVPDCYVPFLKCQLWLLWVIVCSIPNVLSVVVWIYVPFLLDPSTSLIRKPTDINVMTIDKTLTVAATLTS